MTTTLLEKRTAREALKSVREIRNFSVRPELRAGSTTSALGIDGFACTTNDPYEMYDMFGSYDEVVRSGSFAKTLQEQDDVRLLFNHDGIPLARTKSGTLILQEVLDGAQDPQKKNQTGLWSMSDVDPNMHLAQDVAIAMKRGDLDQMSFQFQVTKQLWSPDYQQRDILEVRLFDVSVVTFPASPTTSANVRMAALVHAKRALREGRKLDPEDVNLLTQALGWFSSIDNIVDDAQEALSGYLGVPNPDMPDEPMSMMSSSKGMTLGLARALAAADQLD